MTKSQKQSAEDEWRPGFAKRAANFTRVCAAAERWRWRAGVTVGRISSAVLKGTPGLTLSQRMTLLLCVEHLNQDRLEQDIAAVWPSAALLADHQGCSESVIRGNRAALEAAGFLIRDYNRCNRPAGVEAIDLAPLVARLDELEAADEAIREAANARREQNHESVVYASEGLGKSGAWAPEIRRLEQSPENSSSTVRGGDADAPDGAESVAGLRASRSGSGPASGTSTPRPAAARDGATRSPRSERGGVGARPGPSVRAEMVRQELAAAVQVCPRLASLVPSHVLADPATAGPGVASRIAAAAEELLPEGPQRNGGLTVAWGWKRHGPRVIAMLAIALEDPAIREPSKYFGWMATREPDGAPDLRFNLKRILRAKGETPIESEPPDPPPAVTPESLMAAPGVEDAAWQAIAAQLERRIGPGAWGSWFARVGYHGVSDGVLSLSTPSGLAADRIRRDFLPAIVEACEAAGENVHCVIVSRRGDLR